MDHRAIPARPSLEQYRKQAKDLLDGIARKVPDALARTVARHPRLQGVAESDLPELSIKLADAQLVIAREHGFESWPKFSAHLRAMLGTPADTIERLLPVGNGELVLEVSGRCNARGLVMLVLAGNVSRYHPGIREIAAAFNRASFCTVLADLLTEEEDIEDSIQESLRYDVPLLAGRVLAVVDYVAADATLGSLPMGVFGSGMGAAAAVTAAAKRSSTVRALVCSAGRPDLAGSSLAWLGMPALFLFGGDDTVGYGFMRTLLQVLPPQIPKRLEVIDGATDRFDESTHVARAALLASAWFTEHLVSSAAGEKRS